MFEGCWPILKDAPKWKGGCGYVQDQQQITKKGPETSQYKWIGAFFALCNGVSLAHDGHKWLDTAIDVHGRQSRSGDHHCQRE